MGYGVNSLDQIIYLYTSSADGPSHKPCYLLKLKETTSLHIFHIYIFFPYIYPTEPLKP